MHNQSFKVSSSMEDFVEKEVFIFSNKLCLFNRFVQHSLVWANPVSFFLFYVCGISIDSSTAKQPKLPEFCLPDISTIPSGDELELCEKMFDMIKKMSEVLSNVAKSVNLGTEGKCFVFNQGFVPWYSGLSVQACNAGAVYSNAAWFSINQFGRGSQFASTDPCFWFLLSLIFSILFSLPSHWNCKKKWKSLQKD